ncbi:MAG: S41 family peptidase [Candidatus Eisenbacteria bacterium]
MRSVNQVTRSPRLIAVFAFLLMAGFGSARAYQGYLISPDIHGGDVVFSAEGDLWICRADDGSQVRRITSHAGSEASPRFSPDGRWIAFNGDYDGNRDVFVMPVGGGEPRRLTWHPGPDGVVTWTPDGERIIFSSRRDSPHGDEELYAVAFRGGDPEKLPLGRANWIYIDSGTGAWAFTRTWGGGTWKRYRGGTAPEIWQGHPDRRDYAEITHFDGVDIFPMWHGGRIYFLSDQGGTANLWSVRPDGSDRTRHTTFDRWDVRYPAMGPDGQIVFSLAGDVHLFDPGTGAERTIPVDLPSERILTRRRYPDASAYLTEFALAPDGERVLVLSRGEMFSIPVEDGVTLPITRGSGARECRASFGPQGERIVYITDESHEEAIVTADAWGRGETKVVKPAASTGWHFPPAWSPDGKWIAFADQTHTLYVVEADGGTPRKVDYCESSEINEYVWSPDGRWLAYSKNNSAYFSSIFIHDVRENRTQQVTSWDTNDRTPAWDPDGRYLYFLSDRMTDPVIGWFDFETIVTQPTRPYLVLLRPDVKNPFADMAGMPPTGDEDDGKDKDKDEAKKGDEDKSDAKEDKAEEEDEDKVEPIEITFEGLADRVIEFPVEAGRYFGLAATAGKVFYASVPLQGLLGESPFGEEEEPTAALMAFDHEKKEAEVFMAGIAGFDLQAKAKKILISKGGGRLYVVGTDGPPGDDLSESQVSLDAMVIELSPREEWEQIYYESWRSMRDFYWDAEMHGVDWKGIRDQYAALLPRIAQRSELRDVLAEMIGELSTSHTYVFGGDPGLSAPHLSTGLLGARLAREGDGFRVDRIYRGGAPDRVRSPLQEPGGDVKEGECILAVNHRRFSPDQPFLAAFENLAGKRVMLTVNSKPQMEGSRQVAVTPLSSEGELIYADWVRRNREYVAQKTDGKIGYIHLPDMMGRGLSTFDSWFYTQLDREGMVVDARWNGGGMVSQMILARFQRHVISWGRGRYGGRDTYPYRVLNGPFVVLTNEEAGSDGDIFPAAVQLSGLAPVIGKRSWGGVVGIRGGAPLVDGGMFTRPESPWWDHVRGWGLEGHGVDPDIEIDNLPQDLAKGIDAQLDRGIQEVMRLHAERPPLSPEFGPAPDRSRKAYDEEL